MPLSDMRTAFCAKLEFELDGLPYEIQAAASAPTPSINCCREVTLPRMLG